MMALSIDLGAQQDFTATSLIHYKEVVESKKTLPGLEVRKMEDARVRFEHHLRFLERAEKGTPYPEIIQITRRRMKNPDLADAELLVDATGVGLAVVQQMMESGLKPIGIMITSGTEVGILKSPKKVRLGYKVPKKEIVTALQIAFQSRRLKMPASLPFIKEFVEELQNFRLKITRHANDTYEAWRESIHDDLVLSVGIGVWYLETKYGLGRKILDQNTDCSDNNNYDPLGEM